MPALARQPAANAPQSTASLLVSLSHTLPRGHALARRARQLAHRLNQHGKPPRAMALAGAECLAQLLEAADEPDIGGADIDGFEVLDADFYR